jgi:hypothetical protein
MGWVEVYPGSLIILIWGKGIMLSNRRSISEDSNSALWALASHASWACS